MINEIKKEYTKNLKMQLLKNNMPFKDDIINNALIKIDENINNTNIANNTSSRYIGDLIYSLIPLSDTGLHLADGDLISQTGIYEKGCKVIHKLYDNNIVLAYDFVKNIAVESSGMYFEIDEALQSCVNLQTGIVSQGVDGSMLLCSNNSNLDTLTLTGWEIKTRFKITNQSNITTAPIFKVKIKYNDEITESNNDLQVYLYRNENNKLYCLLYDGKSFSLGGTQSNNLTSKAIFENDIDYYIKLRKVNTYLTLYYSIDGINYNEDNSVQTFYSTDRYIGNKTHVYLFNDGASEVSYGELDLTQTSFTGSILDELNTVSNIVLWTCGDNPHNKINSTCNYFCTEEEWQETYNQYGFCPRFVVDDAAGTIRLPLLKGYMKGVNNIEDLGKINEAGLPNITGAISINNNAAGYSSGAFRRLSTQNRLQGRSGNDNYNDRVDFDASWSNPIYGKSNTVEVDGYNCLIYIVLVNSTAETNTTVDEEQIDIGKLTIEVDKKANRDLDNVNTRILKLIQIVELINGDTEVIFNLDNTKKYIIEYENVVGSAQSGDLAFTLGLNGVFANSNYSNVNLNLHTWKEGIAYSGYQGNGVYGKFGYNSTALQSNISLKADVIFENGVSMLSYKTNILQQSNVTEQELGYSAIRSTSFNQIKLYCSVGAFVSGKIKLYQI